MTSSTTIHLVRHGDVHNPDSVLYARLPGFRLSDRGREQARAAGEALRTAPLAALFSSPQQRAQETAALIAAARGGFAVQTAPLLDEIHTPHEGRPLAEMEAGGWDLYSGIDAVYERPADILRRTTAFISQVRAAYAGQEVAAVTHGDVVTFMILWAKGVPVDGASPPDRANLLLQLGLPEIYPATASISTFVYHSADADAVPIFSYRRPY
jgi:broad specificity phosphatase PhoE